MSNKERVIGGRARMPVNKQSMRVTSEAPDDAPPRYGRTDYGCQDVLDTPSFRPVAYIGPPEHNLIGKTFGRLMVIDYYGKPKNNGPSRWITKCVCGSYSIHVAPSLKRGARKDGPIRCERCKADERLLEMARMQEERSIKEAVDHRRSMDSVASGDGHIRILLFLQRHKHLAPATSSEISKSLNTGRRFTYDTLCGLLSGGYVEAHDRSGCNAWAITKSGEAFVGPESAPQPTTKPTRP